MFAWTCYFSQVSHALKAKDQLDYVTIVYYITRGKIQRLQLVWSLLPEWNEGCNHTNCFRCVLFRVMYTIFHSNSFENLIGCNCRAGWNNDLTNLHSTKTQASSWQIFPTHPLSLNFTRWPSLGPAQVPEEARPRESESEEARL